MKDVNHEHGESEEIVPRQESSLTNLHPDALSPVERLHVFIEKTNAIGRVRMVVADHLIEEGLIKRRRKK